MNKFLFILKDSLKEYIKPDSIVSINCIAFSLLMSLAPMIALLTIFSIRFLQNELWLQDEISNVIPANIVAGFVNVGLETDAFGFIPFVTTIAISIFVASRGFYAIILAFSTPGPEDRNVFHMNLIAVLSPFAFCIFAIVLIGTISFLQIYIPSSMVAVNWMISFAVNTLLCLSFFFLTTYPARHLKYIINGTVVMAVGLTVMSNFFMFIIDNYFNYNDLYGSLAYLLILFLAIVWISSIIYYGYCVNLSTGRYHEDN